MNDKALSEAVAISLDNEINYARLITDLAQTYPAHFMQLLEDDAIRLTSIFMKLDPAVYVEMAKKQVKETVKLRAVCDEMRKNNYVSAIKLVREGSGFGLKEAKDLVVVARDRLIMEGKLASVHVDPDSIMANHAPLSGPQTKIMEAIISHFE